MSDRSLSCFSCSLRAAPQRLNLFLLFFQLALCPRELIWCLLGRKEPPAPWAARFPEQLLFQFLYFTLLILQDCGLHLENLPHSLLLLFPQLAHLALHLITRRAPVGPVSWRSGAAAARAAFTAAPARHSTATYYTTAAAGAWNAAAVWESPAVSTVSDPFDSGRCCGCPKGGTPYGLSIRLLESLTPSPPCA